MLEKYKAVQTDSYRIYIEEQSRAGEMTAVLPGGRIFQSKSSPRQWRDGVDHRAPVNTSDGTR